MVVSADQARVHETPNAVMRTLAAPSLGSCELSVWEVAMDAGQSGPLHTVDSEQVWVLLDGALRACVAGVAQTARAGEAITLPAGVERQIHADDRLRAVVASTATPIVTAAGRDSARLPWAE